MAFFIASAVLLVLGILIGQRVGSELGQRAETSKQYWLWNLAVVAGGIVAIAVLGLMTLVLFEAVALGFIAGGVVGLKLAFGESSGPWKAHDRFYNVNKGHQEAAKGGKGAARRRRRRTGEAAPDLISVEDKPEAAAKDEDK